MAPARIRSDKIKRKVYLPLKNLFLGISEDHGKEVLVTGTLARSAFAKPRREEVVHLQFGKRNQKYISNIYRRNPLRFLKEKSYPIEGDK